MYKKDIKNGCKNVTIVVNLSACCACNILLVFRKYCVE